MVSIVEKGSSPSEGDLAGCAVRPPSGAPLDTGEKASWSFSGCLEEKSEESKWMEGATLWVPDWGLRQTFVLSLPGNFYVGNHISVLNEGHTITLFCV